MRMRVHVQSIGCHTIYEGIELAPIISSDGRLTVWETPTSEAPRGVHNAQAWMFWNWEPMEQGNEAKQPKAELAGSEPDADDGRADDDAGGPGVLQGREEPSCICCLSGRDAGAERERAGPRPHGGIYGRIVPERRWYFWPFF